MHHHMSRQIDSKDKQAKKTKRKIKKRQCIRGTFHSSWKMLVKQSDSFNESERKRKSVIEDDGSSWLLAEPVSAKKLRNDLDDEQISLSTQK